MINPTKHSANLKHKKGQDLITTEGILNISALKLVTKQLQYGTKRTKKCCT